MEKGNNTFGVYVAGKRKEKGISIRTMAKHMGYSAAFWDDVEKGRANPPKYEKLKTLASVLDLNKEDSIQMFDLAGQDRDSVAPDVGKYINDNYFVISGIRQARDLGANENDWQQFIDHLQKRNA